MTGHDRNAMTETSPPADRAPDPARKGAVPVPGALGARIDACALLLDIDGTLVDLAPTPDSVTIEEGLIATLQGLSARLDGALALVSGRSLIDIDRILAPLRVAAIGGHGAEMRLSASDPPRPNEGASMPESLKRRFAHIAQRDEGVLLEDKGYSFALHYRLAPHAEQWIYDEVAAIRADLPEAPIEILSGKFVVEIKPAGFSKATAVRELMTHPPFAGRRPIFLGDDITDETVFAIMPDMNGLAFSVGRKAQGVAGHFDAPRDVRAWLAQLLASPSA
jgi:trehalose 6-phosphate phosphatase